MKIYIIISWFILFSPHASLTQTHTNKDSVIKKVQSSTIEIKNSSLDKLVDNLIKKEKENDSLNIFLPLIAGAALTLFAQLFIEWRKTRIENKNKKIELISEAQAKTYLISQLLKDLAMYKVHKKYYYRASVIFPNSN